MVSGIEHQATQSDPYLSSMTRDSYSLASSSLIPNKFLKKKEERSRDNYYNSRALIKDPPIIQNQERRGKVPLAYSEGCLGCSSTPLHS